MASALGQANQDLVNQLRELGLESINIALPQIAVIGNQSVGKSSVMCALSGVPFPVGSKLTTRCATQVTMRRAKRLSVSVGCSRGDIRKVELTKIEDVAAAIERTTDALMPDSASSGAIETEHFIQIDVQGPTCSNLTVIDLPGIIQTVDERQDEGLIPAIKGLVEGYMSSARTVNLLVMRADVDPAGNEAFQLARKHDPDGSRTLGVLTCARDRPARSPRGTALSHIRQLMCVLRRPASLPASDMDRVEPSKRPGVLDTMKGKHHQLKLGYHAVVCRSGDDIEKGCSAHDVEEDGKRLFSKEFSSLDSGACGINRLKERLGPILDSLIERSLPDVLREIEHMRVEKKSQLDKLGPSVGTQEEKRAFLRQFTKGVRGNVEQVKAGNFGAVEQADFKFVASLRREHESFCDEVRKIGVMGSSLDDEEMKHLGLRRVIGEDWLKKDMHISFADGNASRTASFMRQRPTTTSVLAS